MKWLRDRYENSPRLRQIDTMACYLFHEAKKIYGDEGWGYREKDFNNIESMPAKIIRNSDMHEISWNNKSATDLERLLKKEG